jgi:hypothetical protein
MADAMYGASCCVSVVGNSGVLEHLDDKGAKMKPLLTCLLVGCLVSPVWGHERNWTLEEFVQKLEDGQPWTREKAETQLGVKLTDASPTGRWASSTSRWFVASGRFVYGEGLIVNLISYNIWAKDVWAKKMICVINA